MRRIPLPSAVAVLALLVALTAIRADADDPVEFGILPTLSARTILGTYQPVREYLEQGLGRPVLLVTAPDYRSYIERTAARKYRYLVTAPHFARLAQVESGYKPLFKVKRALNAQIVALKGGPVERIEDLRNKVVTTPDPLAIISVLGIQLLRQHGLEPGNDVEVRSTPSFNTAVLAVDNGESSAAVTAATALRQMPEPVRSAVKFIGNESSSVPHVMYLASPDVPDAELEHVRRLLVEFATSSESGKQFFERTGFKGLEPVSDEELAALDPYLEDLRQLLEPKPADR